MFDCQHPSSRLVKIIADGTGVPMYACQCVTCGRKATKWIPKTSILFPNAVMLESSKIPTIREMLAAEDVAMRAEYEKMKEGAYALRRKFYDNYLKSPQWKHLRTQVSRRASGICERCFNAPIEQTHHLNYERLGNELLSDLLGVCAPCHELLHGIEKRKALQGAA